MLDFLGFKILKGYIYFMRPTLKLPLMIACLAALTLVSGAGFAPSAYSQNEKSASPVPSPAAASSSVPAPSSPLIEEGPVSSELTVIELFSSQACVFCPQADELFAALLTVPRVIGYACHVDYFDVRVGSLSHPFCSARQTWYMQSLGAGPNYTPQLVINGALDVVAYKLDEITMAIDKAQKKSPLPMQVAAATTPKHFTLSWKPQSAPADHEPAILWLMMIDKPHELQIADGRNKGKRMTYFNIVSDLEDRGDWNRAALGKDIEVDLKPEHQGFIVIAQGRKSGQILAAAEYRLPTTQPKPAPASE